MSSLLLLLALTADPTISIEFHGTLREALREVANKGGLSLVVTGELDVPAEVVLKDVTAEEALGSMARAYDLQLKHEGKLWVIKPVTEATAASPVAPIAPVPPIPPTPGPGAGGSENDPDAIRERADQLREEADALRETAQDLREARRDELAAAKDQARARLEVAAAGSGSSNDLVSMSGPLTVMAGSRVDSATSYGGSVTIKQGARVAGDVVSFAGDVILEEGARVDGDAVSWGGRVIKAEGAHVHGQEASFGAKGLGSMMASKALQATAHPRLESGKAKEGTAVAAFFAEFAGLFGLGFLLMMFAPARMRTIEAELRQAPLKNGLAGLLAAIGSIPLMVILFLSFIGWPVLVAFVVGSCLCLLMGLVAVANTLGARVPVPRLRRTQAFALALGLLVMLLVARIPIIGVPMIVAAALVSMGAIIRTRLGRGQGVPIPTASFLGSTPVG